MSSAHTHHLHLVTANASGRGRQIVLDGLPLDAIDGSVRFEPFTSGNLAGALTVTIAVATLTVGAAAPAETPEVHPGGAR